MSEVIEKPILFTPAMVAAILRDESPKTVTRRVLKPQPVNVPDGAYIDPYDEDYNRFTVWTSDDKMCLHCGGDRKDMAHWRSPYGQPGTILYVKETHWRWGYWEKTQTRKSEPEKWRFVACDECNEPLFSPPPFPDILAPADRTHIGYHKRPSIFMSRKFARIFLRVKDVSVERVQDISEEGAIAEGVLDGGCLHCGNSSYPKPCGCNVPTPDYIDAFAWLWDSINGKKPGCDWDSNPWCWCVSFERVKQEAA